MMDKDVVGTLEEAQEHLKDQDQVNEKLQDIIFETQ